MSSKVTILVPCRNEEKNIASCLNSIINQDYPKNLIEVLIIDGMSTDRTRFIIKNYIDKYNFIKLLDNPKKIVPSALNLGIKAATGDIIIRMDVHTKYAEDYVTQCIKILNQTSADNVGGPWVASGESYVQKAIAKAFQSKFSSGGAGSHNHKYTGYIDSVYLGCWKKSTLEKIGLFDEELVRNQDDELNLRIIRSGGKIWQSSSIKSWYYPRSSIRSLFKQYMQYGYWKVRVIQKHKIPASIRHIIPGTFLVFLTISLLLGIKFKISRLFFILMIGTYLIFNLIATLSICKKPQNWKYIPIIPFVLAAFHLGYGYGFLRGLLDFIVFKKLNIAKFSQLTRS